jgi:hypothetical protein
VFTNLKNCEESEKVKEILIEEYAKEFSGLRTFIELN